MASGMAIPSLRECAASSQAKDTAWSSPTGWQRSLPRQPPNRRFAKVAKKMGSSPAPAALSQANDCWVWHPFGRAPLPPTMPLGPPPKPLKEPHEFPLPEPLTIPIAEWTAPDFPHPGPELKVPSSNTVMPVQSMWSTEIMSGFSLQIASTEEVTTQSPTEIASSVYGAGTPHRGSAASDTSTGFLAMSQVSSPGLVALSQVIGVSSSGDSLSPAG